jgi:hypothetical protein
VTVLATITTSAGLVVTAAPSSAGVPSLKVPAGMPRAIEPLAAYVGQVACQPAFRSGTRALGRLLVSTYPNTTFGGNYDCGTDSSQSEHYEGRAVDWMNSVRNKTQAAQGASVINFLLATDRYGTTFANARRLGIMYIIWNNRIWGSWDGKWEPYNNCASTPAVSSDNACHRNHMHFSLSWNGALGRTSFWSKHVAATDDYGPCRARDLNWSGDYGTSRPTPCPRYPEVAAPAGSSAVMRALVSYSGATIFPDMSGRPVSAVQQAFDKPVTGHYDSATVAAMNRYKKAHHLSTNGIIDGRTWRALLVTYEPKA